MIPGATAEMLASQERLQAHAADALTRPSPATLDGLLYRRPELADLTARTYARELARWSA